MVLLATSDLHGTLPDLLSCALARGHGGAAVLLAGDLLNLFGQDAPDEQAQAMTAWLQGLASQVPVVACSGNHDVGSVYGAGWLQRAAETMLPAGRLFTDGSHAIIEGLVVTAVPYWNLFERGVAHQDWLRSQAQDLWRQGRQLADRHHLPWAVLHHEPPAGLAVAAGVEVEEPDRGAPPHGWCRHWIELYRPDYVFSGHLHQAPLSPGGSWAARVPDTGTWCFNPGRIGQGSGLIALDAERRVARWFTSWNDEACQSLKLGPVGVI